MQREINKDKLEGSMVLVWIDGAVCVVPIALDSLWLMVPMLGAFQGSTDKNHNTTVLRLGADEAKVANALAEQITVKAMKGKKK